MLYYTPFEQYWTVLRFSLDLMKNNRHLLTPQGLSLYIFYFQPGCSIITQLRRWSAQVDLLNQVGVDDKCMAWLGHNIEPLYALPAICDGNPLVIDGVLLQMASNELFIFSLLLCKC